MPRAEGRYRALVERTGARFEYHDGGMEDGAQRLQQQLTAADLVVCQAGCLNHAAYRTIKGHCKRLDKPCLFLERPSLSQFARCLQAASGVPVAEVVDAAAVERPEALPHPPVHPQALAQPALLPAVPALRS
jgi:hypothetical protein